MQQENGYVSTRPVVRMFRKVVPWVALFVVAWAIAGYLSDFQRMKGTATAEAQGSSVTTSTAGASASVATTVTDLLATVRTDVPLRSQPDTATAVVATSREGSTLDVLTKQGTWFRVKDAAGHIGWIPNDPTYISVKTKKK